MKYKYNLSNGANYIVLEKYKNDSKFVAIRNYP